MKKIKRSVLLRILFFCQSDTNVKILMRAQEYLPRFPLFVFGSRLPIHPADRGVEEVLGFLGNLSTEHRAQQYLVELCKCGFDSSGKVGTGKSPGTHSYPWNKQTYKQKNVKILFSYQSKFKFGSIFCVPKVQNCGHATPALNPAHCWQGLAGLIGHPA